MVISAVPSKDYKVKTEWLKDGVICINVAAEKNFEKDVREKVRLRLLDMLSVNIKQASVYLPSIGKVTILMLLRNLWVIAVNKFYPC